MHTTRVDMRSTKKNADLVEWMVPSLRYLVEYAPGNAKKVTLGFYVDCELYTKH